MSDLPRRVYLPGICGTAIAVLCLILSPNPWTGFQAYGQEGDLQQGRAAIESGDYAKALELLAPLAERGDHHAQNAMGVLHQMGGGVPRDYAKARAWYLKAAEQGDANASVNLGRLYDDGLGVTRDFSKAAFWYKRGAERGNPVGAFFLGSMYARGEGFSQDFGKALEWYRRAADQGEPVSMSRIGLMYEKGQGVDKDVRQALDWYFRSAQGGYPPAMERLAEIYRTGQLGQKADPREADYWSFLMFSWAGDLRVAPFRKDTRGVPGRTLANRQLQADVLRMLRALSSGDCGALRVVQAGLLGKPKIMRYQGGPPHLAQWNERWAIERCGKQSSFDIIFTSNPDGGTRFSVLRVAP